MGAYVCVWFICLAGETRRERRDVCRVSIRMIEITWMSANSRSTNAIAIADGSEQSSHVAYRCENGSAFPYFKFWCDKESDLARTESSSGLHRRTDGTGTARRDELHDAMLRWCDGYKGLKTQLDDECGGRDVEVRMGTITSAPMLRFRQLQTPFMGMHYPYRVSGDP